MKKITIATQVHVYPDRAAIPEDLQKLLQVAEENAHKSYAPYSRFQVGAAILLNNGVIIGGNNQENSVYPTGLCAERTALFYAASQYPGVPILKIAVTAVHPQNPVQFPFHLGGSCRQALLEYEVKYNQPIQVIILEKQVKCM